MSRSYKYYKYVSDKIVLFYIKIIVAWDDFCDREIFFFFSLEIRMGQVMK